MPHYYGRSEYRAPNYLADFLRGRAEDLKQEKATGANLALQRRMAEEEMQRRLAMLQGKEELEGAKSAENPWLELRRGEMERSALERQETRSEKKLQHVEDIVKYIEKARDGTGFGEKRFANLATYFVNLLRAQNKEDEANLLIKTLSGTGTLEPMSDVEPPLVSGTEGVGGQAPLAPQQTAPLPEAPQPQRWTGVLTQEQEDAFVRSLLEQATKRKPSREPSRPSTLPPEKPLFRRGFYGGP